MFCPEKSAAIDTPRSERIEDVHPAKYHSRYRGPGSSIYFFSERHLYFSRETNDRWPHSSFHRDVGQNFFRRIGPATPRKRAASASGFDTARRQRCAYCALHAQYPAISWPWRFSDAGRNSAWIGPSCRRPKTCTATDSCSAADSAVIR
jgi:hypothetical protein